MNIVITKLKDLRKSRDWSQAEVARRLNMEQNTYSNLETGKSSVSLEKILKISELYEISPSELIESNTVIQNIGPNHDNTKIAYIIQSDNINEFAEKITAPYKEMIELISKNQERLVDEIAKLKQEINKLKI